jgi:hypothetical protein
MNYYDIILSIKINISVMERKKTPTQEKKGLSSLADFKPVDSPVFARQEPSDTSRQSDTPPRSDKQNTPPKKTLAGGGLSGLKLAPQTLVYPVPEKTQEVGKANDPDKKKESTDSPPDTRIDTLATRKLAELKAAHQPPNSEIIVPNPPSAISQSKQSDAVPPELPATKPPEQRSKKVLDKSDPKVKVVGSTRSNSFASAFAKAGLVEASPPQSLEKLSNSDKPKRQHYDNYSLWKKEDSNPAYNRLAHADVMANKAVAGKKEIAKKNGYAIPPSVQQSMYCQALIEEDNNLSPEHRKEVKEALRSEPIIGIPFYKNLNSTVYTALTQEGVVPERMIQTGFQTPANLSQTMAMTKAFVGPTKLTTKEFNGFTNTLPTGIMKLGKNAEGNDIEVEYKLRNLPSDLEGHDGGPPHIHIEGEVFRCDAIGLRELERRFNIHVEYKPEQFSNTVE